MKEMCCNLFTLTGSGADYLKNLCMFKTDFSESLIRLICTVQNFGISKMEEVSYAHQVCILFFVFLPPTYILFFLLELNSPQFVPQQMFPESSSTAERSWEGDVVKYFIFCSLISEFPAIVSITAMLITF